MNAAKKMSALAMCAGLLAGAGCSQEQVQTLEQQVAELKLENERLKGELATASDARAHDEQSLANVTKQFEEAAAGAAAMGNQLAEARQKLNSAERAATEATAAMKAAQTEHAKSLSEAQAQIADLTQQVAQLTQKLADAEKLIDTLKKSVPQLPETPPQPTSP